MPSFEKSFHPNLGVYTYRQEVNPRILQQCGRVWAFGLKVTAITLLREIHKGMSLTDAKGILEDYSNSNSY